MILFLLILCIVSLLVCGGLIEFWVKFNVIDFILINWMFINLFWGFFFYFLGWLVLGLGVVG